MTTPAAPLLATFVEAERHGRLYTGGKVQVGAPHTAASGGDAEQGAFLVCPCGPELNVIDLVSAQVLLTVPADEDEFTAFALHPTDRRELVPAGRSRQLRSWSLDFAAKSCECVRRLRKILNRLAAANFRTMLATPFEIRTIKSCCLEAVREQMIT